MIIVIIPWLRRIFAAAANLTAVLRTGSRLNATGQNISSFISTIGHHLFRSNWRSISQHFILMVANFHT